MKTLHKVTCLLALLALLLAGMPAQSARAAATLTVNTTSDADNNSDGVCSLREAIIAANSNANYNECTSTGYGADTINFDNTLGTATITLSGSALPNITDTDGLTIHGGADITISGGGSYQAFLVISGASLTLDRIKVTNGSSTNGGGVFNDGSLTITNSTFSLNSAAGDGGGIENYGTLIMTNSTFSGNRATGDGGGVGNAITGTLTITDSTFSGNSSTSVSSDGGGVYNEGTLTITNSTFSGNSTYRGGGVGNVYPGTLTITDSTFSGNTATTGDGGGVDSGGTLIMTNSTFSHNSAKFGGGVVNNSGVALIFNSTFSGNTATTYGGAVAMWKGRIEPPTTTIHNTILANSTAPEDCWNGYDGTYNLSGLNNLIEAPFNCSSISTITSDPKLGGLTGSPAYFPLKAGSPAIDAGDDVICGALPVNNTSQNGVTRPQGAHCDIGSFELKIYWIYLPLVIR